MTLEISGRWTGWPAVIYVRISAADLRALKLSRRKGLTDTERLEALTGKVREHLADCLDFAADAGLVVVEKFSELGSAGPLRTKALGERDRLEAWLAGRAGPVVVLTTEVSRLYREVADGLGLVSEAKRLPGLVVLDTNERAFDLSDYEGRADFIDACNKAERESRVVSHRRRRKERRRARAGGWWGTRPFGYSIDRDEDDEPTGSLTILPDEARLIRDGAAWVIAEAAAHPDTSPSMAAVAAAWDRAGSVTPAGGPWRGKSAGRVLAARRYAPYPGGSGGAVRVHRAGTTDGRAPRDSPGVESEAMWPPILDEATHAAVAAILAHPRRRTNHGSVTPRWALAGLVWCGRCGHRMRSAPYATDDPRRRWICPHHSQGGCAGVSRDMEPVEAYVREVVFWWLRDGGEYEQALTAGQAAGGSAPARTRLDEIDAALAGLDAEEDRLADKVAAAGFGDLSAKVAARQASRRAALTAEADTLRARLRASAAATARPAEIDWPGMTVPRRREWLARWVARVVIHPAVPGRHWFDPARIQVVPAGGGPPASPPPCRP